MAIQIREETTYGEDRDIYVRLNNIEASNHGVQASALFRGFLSKQAFEDGKHYVFEKTVEFDADVSSSLWEQAYNFLKGQYPDAKDC